MRASLRPLAARYAPSQLLRYLPGVRNLAGVLRPQTSRMFATTSTPPPGPEPAWDATDERNLMGHQDDGAPDATLAGASKHPFGRKAVALKAKALRSERERQRLGWKQKDPTASIEDSHSGDTDGATLLQELSEAARRDRRRARRALRNFKEGKGALLDEAYAAKAHTLKWPHHAVLSALSKSRIQLAIAKKALLRDTSSFVEADEPSASLIDSHFGEADGATGAYSAEEPSEAALGARERSRARKRLRKEVEGFVLNPASSSDAEADTPKSLKNSMLRALAKSRIQLTVAKKLLTVDSSISVEADEITALKAEIKTYERLFTKAFDYIAKATATDPEEAPNTAPIELDFDFNRQPPDPRSPAGGRQSRFRSGTSSAAVVEEEWDATPTFPGRPPRLPMPPRFFRLPHSQAPTLAQMHERLSPPPERPSLRKFESPCTSVALFSLPATTTLADLGRIALRAGAPPEAVFGVQLWVKTGAQDEQDGKRAFELGGTIHFADHKTASAFAAAPLVLEVGPPARASGDVAPADDDARTQVRVFPPAEDADTWPSRRVKQLAAALSRKDGRAVRTLLEGAVVEECGAELNTPRLPRILLADLQALLKRRPDAEKVQDAELGAGLQVDVVEGEEPAADANTEELSAAPELDADGAAPALAPAGTLETALELDTGADPQPELTAQVEDSDPLVESGQTVSESDPGAETPAEMQVQEEETDPLTDANAEELSAAPELEAEGAAPAGSLETALELDAGAAPQPVSQAQADNSDPFVESGQNVSESDPGADTPAETAPTVHAVHTLELPSDIGADPLPETAIDTDEVLIEAADPFEGPPVETAAHSVHELAADLEETGGLRSVPFLESGPVADVDADLDDIFPTAGDPPLAQMAHNGLDNAMAQPSNLVVVAMSLSFHQQFSPSILASYTSRGVTRWLALRVPGPSLPGRAPAPKSEAVNPEPAAPEDDEHADPVTALYAHALRKALARERALEAELRDVRAKQAEALRTEAVARVRADFCPFGALEGVWVRAARVPVTVADGEEPIWKQELHALVGFADAHAASRARTLLPVQVPAYAGAMLRFVREPWREALDPAYKGGTGADHEVSVLGGAREGWARRLQRERAAEASARVRELERERERGAATGTWGLERLSEVKERLRRMQRRAERERALAAERERERAAYQARTHVVSSVTSEVAGSDSDSSDSGSDSDSDSDSDSSSSSSGSDSDSDTEGMEVAEAEAADMPHSDAGDAQPKIPYVARF
ncbi:hypothetical protein B0H15DRAFT_819811 [Mycena belliarum]|uniref:Uncharacterized protein n=1 Tax=Mycena belliarum TaxID=1033014 RepID=A0AAD6UF88_9AGAR|nr:hypothetical protein B0H15DRAFT_819811 [Mycena belliae]